MTKIYIYGIFVTYVCDLLKSNDKRQYNKDIFNDHLRVAKDKRLKKIQLN